MLTIIHTHESVGRGEMYDMQSVRNTLLPSSLWEKSVFASDMDQTMFLNDMGSLVFIEYLHNPAFYAIEPEELRRLILPAGTEWFFEHGSNGEIPGVSASECCAAQDLAAVIIEQFTAIRTEMLEGVDTPQRRERLLSFMQNICKLDSMLIHLKNQHTDPHTSASLAKSFSRLRLFGGQESALIERMTQEALALTHDHPERLLPLRAGDSKQDTVDRLVQVNGSIYHLLDQVKEEGATGFAVTGSPSQIASAAIRNSVYQPIIMQEQIIATRLELQACGIRLNGTIEGDMIVGANKSLILEKLSNTIHKKVMLAVGDLPGSDAAMGAMVLNNNGVFVITHHPDHLEESRAGFHAYLERIMGTCDLEHAQDRIWYVPAKPLQK